MRVIFEALTSW